jgi:hypothetical protein
MYKLVQVKEHYYLLDTKDIFYDGFGFNDDRLKMGFYFYDKEEKVIGRLSHVGGPWNFKGTVQLNGDPDLHVGRVCGFNLHRVIASTDPTIGLPNIDVEILEKNVASV